MEIQELYNFSKEELVSKIQELEDKLFRQNDLMDKVREHKHNYSENFGLVVSAPVQALLKEVMINPDVFTVDERNRIIKMYTDCVEMRGIYECLGWPIGIQLNKVKNIMVPKIRENAHFFSDIIGRALTYKDKWLIEKLRMALDETEPLCCKLENIETFEYGISEPFNLKAEIKDAFNKYNSTVVFWGGTSIQFEMYFEEFSDVQVDMNKKNFRSCVLGNIIKNLQDHAFKDIDDSRVVSPMLNNCRSLWAKIILSWKKIKLNFSRLCADNPKKCLSDVNYFEKKVRILFEKDEKSDHRINLIIENNGKEFDGDLDTVFDNGVGNGSGIGLYSARQFLKYYGANIKMYVNADEEYKVGFIINLPIL